MNGWYAGGVNKPPRSWSCRGRDTRRRRSDVSATVPVSLQPAKPTCKHKGCDRPGRSRGYCFKHYSERRRAIRRAERAVHPCPECNYSRASENAMCFECSIADALPETAEGVVLLAVDAGHFEVREDGTVWRHLQRYGGGGDTRHIEPCRAEARMGNGYLGIKVQIERRQYWMYAHRLVWEKLNGPIPEGLEINHIDRDRTNNRPCNLEVVTPSENMRHAYSTPGPKPGTRRTPQHVIDKARALRATGLTYVEVGQRLGISEATVRKYARDGRVVAARLRPMVESLAAQRAAAASLPGATQGVTQDALFAAQRALDTRYTR